jgi:hypothetical protein
MRKCLSSLGLTLGLSLAFVLGAMARPATVKDLAGRTICYSNGMKATYFRGGKYANNVIGNGTWRVTSVDLQLDTERAHEVIVVEIQPDHTILLPVLSLTGKDCK